MKKPNITKGEWILNPNGEIISGNDTSKNGGIDIIARVYMGFNPETNYEAKLNSQLLFSAPDLAEALNEALEVATRNLVVKGETIPIWYQKALDALIKAGYTE